MNELRMTEAAYWQSCRNLSTEIDSAIAIFETNEEVNRLARTDENILRCLNESPLFWRVHTYSLQASLFMTLGRLFDRNPDADSIHKFLAATVGQPEMFSKDALANRKRGGGPEPEWLQDYLADVWEPSAADLRPMKKLLAVHARHFEEIYRPIRHAFYAHRLLDPEAVWRLFEKTNREEVGRILGFLRELIDEIEDLYLNGRQPLFGQGSHSEKYREHIRSEARSLLYRLLGNGTKDDNLN
jgi:hypothetical protein